MKTFVIKLLKKRLIARDTYSYVFEKPSDFIFHAGQYLSLCVEEPEVAMPSGTMRELSIASAPYESELVLAWRFRESRAKQLFMQLEPGDTAYMQGPFGEFKLEKGQQQVVFLAGGIGIVPFMSMLNETLRDGDDRLFYLFFSNRSQEDIPFLSELEELTQSAPNLTLIRTLTAASPASWKHETGYISPLLIRKYLTPVPIASYYISGPQRFVGGMWDVLETLGVEPSRIHGEEFTGY